MPVPRGVKWWIPGVGLLVSATLVTAGFGWTIDRATHRHAEEALESAGIDGVAVANDYRDVTLTGPASVEDVAVTAVAHARLVQDVTYVAEGEPAPQPEPSTPTPRFRPRPRGFAHGRAHGRAHADGFAHAQPDPRPRSDSRRPRRGDRRCVDPLRVGQRGPLCSRPRIARCGRDGPGP